MRTRIDKYTIVGDRQIKLETPITIEDVRLIINETKKIVITSSMQKDNITIEGGVITYTDALPISEIGDYFTIEIDKGETIKDILGDANVLLADVAEGKRQIAEAINERGGNANPNSAFTQLAQDIEDIPNFPTTGFEYTSEIYRPRTLIEAYENRLYLKKVVNNYIEILENSAFYSCTSLQSVEFSNLITIAGSAFYGCTSLQSVICPKLVKIAAYAFYRCTSLQSVEFPELVTITGNESFYGCTSLQSVVCPNLIDINGIYIFSSCPSLQNVILGTIIACRASILNSASKLRNITIGQNTDIDLPFQQWTATNVISEGQSGIDELNANLYNNLLTKLADHSTDGQTRTLRLGWLAHVTQENIDYANAKGWTLTT